MSLRWRWQRFEELGADGVYDMLALRARVFILEQGPYLDPDGADRSAWHLLGRDEAGALLAYLRVLDPGVKFDEPSIGRVVVDASLRGQGIGHELMRAGCRTLFGTVAAANRPHQCAGASAAVLSTSRLRDGVGRVP